MRTLWLVLASTVALAGCQTAPPQSRSPAAEQHLQQLLSGKVAGASRSCLPHFRSSDMIVIDDDTVLFRDGSRRVWRTEMRGNCGLLGSAHYTLVTRSFGGSGPCGGDIAQLVDLSSGMTAGTCVWGDFVPYSAVAP
jgi:hypothetical protein